MPSLTVAGNGWPTNARPAAKKNNAAATLMVASCEVFSLVHVILCHVRDHNHTSRVCSTKGLYIPCWSSANDF